MKFLLLLIILTSCAWHKPTVNEMNKDAMHTMMPENSTMDNDAGDSDSGGDSDGGN